MAKIKVCDMQFLEPLVLRLKASSP